MANYNIRYAEEDDIPQIMKFIDEYWRKNHILATDRRLFEWQYINNKLNMVLGEDENQEICAILGFIPYSEKETKDFSLALWKAKEGTAFLGVKLLMFLLKEEPHRHVFCNGINVDTTAGIYQRFGFQTGKLKQWYRLQPVEKYKIAKILNNEIPSSNIDVNEIGLIKLDSFQSLKNIASTKMFDIKTVPFKSEEYFSKRYFKHPFYNYMVYGIKEESETIDSAIVIRIEECNNSKAMRIVDFIGNYEQIYLITKQIDELAQNFGAEYVDMFEMGLKNESLLRAGWKLVGENENIIPNYFAPYIQCNVDINICTTDGNIILFKGDGDQDRPN